MIKGYVVVTFLLLQLLLSLSFCLIYLLILVFRQTFSVGASPFPLYPNRRQAV